MSRWGRAGEDNEPLRRNGSFSSSSASYYPIANEGVEMESEQHHHSSSSSSSSQSSSQHASTPSPQPNYPPSAAQPYHLPPHPPTTESPPPIYTQYNPEDPSTSPSTSPLPSSSPSKLVTVSFRTLSGQVMSVTFPSLDSLTVLDLKRRLEEVHAIPVSFQRLIFSGRELNTDTDTVQSFGMEDGSMVHLLLRQNQVAGSPSAAAPVAGEEGMGLFNGINIPIQPAGEGAAISEEDAERLVHTVRVARAIKFLALISVLGLLLLASGTQSEKYRDFTWPLMSGSVLAMAGYYGAHQFNAKLLPFFFLYIGCSIAARVAFMVLMAQVQYYVVFSFGVLLDLYLARLTATLYRLCVQLTPGERQELIMLSRPNFGPAY